MYAWINLWFVGKGTSTQESYKNSTFLLVYEKTRMYGSESSLGPIHKKTRMYGLQSTMGPYIPSSIGLTTKFSIKCSHYPSNMEVILRIVWKLGLYT